MRSPGRPRIKEMVVLGLPGMIESTMRYNVKLIPACRTRVPPTTICVEKQNVPNKSRTRMSSTRLCRVTALRENHAENIDRLRTEDVLSLREDVIGNDPQREDSFCAECRQHFSK